MWRTTTYSRSFIGVGVLGIRFNSAGAMAELRRNLVVAMKQLQGEFLRESQSGMRTPEGANSLYEGDVEVVADAIISAYVIGGADAAKDVFGVGSLMADESENPGLADYKQSELWNPDRDDNTIRSRDRRNNPYTDIYGNQRNSRSNRGGIDLERKGGKFAPQPPSFALQTAARWMENGRFQEVLQNAVASVDWAKYFVETKE